MRPFDHGYVKILDVLSFFQTFHNEQFIMAFLKKN